VSSGVVAMNAVLLPDVVEALRAAEQAGLCRAGLCDDVIRSVSDHARFELTATNGRRIVRGAPANDPMAVMGLSYEEMQSLLGGSEADGN